MPHYQPANMYILNSNYMFRKTILLLATVCWAVAGVGQTQVSIDDPLTWTASDLQDYVGQTITFTTPMYVCNNYYYSRGELSISPRRIYSPTNQALPLSNEYNTIVSLNNSGMVTLTGVDDYHRMGERIADLTVRVNSTSRLSVVGTPKFTGNTRQDMEKGHPSVDMVGEHSLLVCAFNLEYYLAENLGTGFGPDNQSEADRQHTKIMAALSKIPADIFGFVEIEQGQTAIGNIASALTQTTGRQYSYIDDGGSASGSYTKAGYVYCTETVEPHGRIIHNNTSVSNRKKLQAFKEKATGEIFIFSLNHFKAKSGTGTGLDANQGDGQGIFNYTRTQEAKSVLSNYENNKNYYQDNDILIMGDLNAYGKEDPITLLTDADMTDLHRYFHADSSYSYVYREQAGYLDHALANSTLLPQVTGMAAYHINSDEHDSFTYDKSSDLTMFRSSDHDPILVGLSLGKINGIPNADNDFEQCEITFNNGQPTIQHAKGGYYRIYDIAGNLIHQGDIAESIQPIYITLSAGFYIMQVYVEHRLKTLKFKIL